MTATVLQYVASCAVLGTLALATESMHVEWTGGFVLALLWLVLALSVGAVLLLFYLIRHGEAARVASLFYLVPITTAVLAWLLFDERLAPPALVGFALAACGVALARAPAAPAPGSVAAAASL